MITVYGFSNESFWLGVDPGEPALRKKIDTQRASTADLGSFSVAKVLAVEKRNRKPAPGEKWNAVCEP